MIVFEDDTKIEELDDDPNILRFKFTFTPVSNLSKIPKNSNVDVLGIVKEFSDVEKLNLKSGETKEKRTVTVYDETNSSVEVVRNLNLNLDLVGRLCLRRFPGYRTSSLQRL